MQTFDIEEIREQLDAYEQMYLSPNISKKNFEDVIQNIGKHCNGNSPIQAVSYNHMIDFEKCVPEVIGNTEIRKEVITFLIAYNLARVFKSNYLSETMMYSAIIHGPEYLIVPCGPMEYNEIKNYSENEMKQGILDYFQFELDMFGRKEKYFTNNYSAIVQNLKEIK